MKIRIRFSKYGAAKFIGHLDVMRYFQKAFVRAEIPVEYSKGYSPHQLTSFAAPLGVGITSDGEYMDAVVREEMTLSQMKESIQTCMADGFFIREIITLPEDSKNAMSVVAAADYVLSLKTGNFPNLYNQFLDFISRDSILVMKKTKKSEKEFDIKPLIYQTAAALDELEYKTQTKYPDNLTVQQYAPNELLYLQLAAGSEANLKPELVMKSFYQFFNMEWKDSCFQIHRLELYEKGTDEHSRQYKPLIFHERKETKSCRN